MSAFILEEIGRRGVGPSLANARAAAQHVSSVGAATPEVRRAPAFCCRVCAVLLYVCAWLRWWC